MTDSEERALVSVIVPTRGRPEAVRRCLESIFASDYPRLEVLVIDDSGPPDDVVQLRRAFPRARVVRNEKRMLLAATRNVGIRMSGGDLLFFVDDDNVIEKTAISELVAGVASTGAGVVAPLIYYLSDPARIWYAGSWTSPVSGMAVFPHRGATGVSFPHPFRTVGFHDAFMVRRSVFDRVGLFDSVDFPIYLSEADFAERMKRQGITCSVAPGAKVWHDVPIFGGIRNLLRHMHITEPSRAYYVARNRIIYMRRYRNPSERFLFLTFFLPVIGLLHLVTILGSSNVGKIYFVRHYIGGIIDGLRA